MTNKSILLKEKNELELQNKEYFKQIEKLTANYVSNIRFKSFRSIICKYDCNIINIKFIIVILYIFFFKVLNVLLDISTKKNSLLINLNL